jgi:hypothetical protein
MRPIAGEKGFSWKTYHNLQIKLITYAFNRSNAINAELLTYFPDMDIDGAVSHDHIVAPNMIEDLIPEEYASGT